jgi:beta-glucanase (GH16 family)
MNAARRYSVLLATLVGFVLVAGLIGPQEIVAGTNTFNEKSIKQWTLKGSLTELPQRVSEVLPLSDQQNKVGWVKFEPMWDEFDQPTLDTNKWTVGMYWWQGRQPAWFNPRNVVVQNGQLQLTMRREEVPAEMKARGYHDYSSAALHTKARSSYGYYEVKARAMSSGGSSSFWFQQETRRCLPVGPLKSMCSSSAASQPHTTAAIT